MNIMIGDTIVYDKEIGIVENRSGSVLTVRFPESGNRRIPIHRNQALPLGDLIYQARFEGKPLRLANKISLAGDSTLADLVALFGYSTGLMRTESLKKVVRQLLRAGLEIFPETDRWNRDDKFKVSLPAVPLPREEDDDGDDDRTQTETKQQTLTSCKLPDPFWPSALGLDRRRELEFLRALWESDPVLCLLHVPCEAQAQAWIQGTWEGIIGWAFRAVQHFIWGPEDSAPNIQVRVGPAALLHTYLKPSVLDGGAPGLHDAPHALNLITIKRELELPTDFARLSAVWPGPIFEFKPDYQGKPSADIQSINQCLSLAAGMAPDDATDQSPLSVLNWAKTASAQLKTRPVMKWGELLSSNLVLSFKGSNEGSTSLGLKVHLANWLRKANASDDLLFEYTEDGDDQVDDETGELPILRKRIDLHVEGMGDFEIESMRGSGPMESFYHKKIFSRVKKGTRFWLIVPTEAILWAGLYLSDLAHHLGENNGVMVPSGDGSFLKIAGKSLVPLTIEPLPPAEATVLVDRGVTPLEGTVKLSDVVGYDEVRRRIDEMIIWPEKHRSLLRRASRSSGILFFGPPGCGKSRWAMAIAGELEQEVRLLVPSDLRGPYIGWGQIMIREQFDWLAENDKRMLIIDELDAVTRSRHESQMHSDEKACVNELLVQIDRVLRLGRLMVATTNFIGSMDDAVMRSGRFGRFIPVSPPDLDESVEIVDFYLKGLNIPTDPESKLRIQVPERNCLRAIIEPLSNENLEIGRFYCGADLEEAVNRAFLRSARRDLPDGGWNQELDVAEVHLTDEDLKRSLKEVPRSVQKDAVDQFMEDVNRFCDRAIAESISTRLRPTSVT